MYAKFEGNQKGSMLFLIDLTWNDPKRLAVPSKCKIETDLGVWAQWAGTISFPLTLSFMRRLNNNKMPHKERWGGVGWCEGIATARCQPESTHIQGDLDDIP